MQEPPRVVVRAPGQVPPAPPRRLPLRWVLAALVALGAVTTVALVRQQAHRRETDRVVLELAPDPATFVSVIGNRAGEPRVLLSVPLVLINRGGRSLRPLSGSVAGSALAVARGETTRPGERVDLVLRQEVTCPPDAPPPAARAGALLPERGDLCG